MEKLDDESECVYQFRLNFINNFKLKNKDMKEKIILDIQKWQLI